MCRDRNHLLHASRKPARSALTAEFGFLMPPWGRRGVSADAGQDSFTWPRTRDAASLQANQSLACGSDRSRSLYRGRHITDALAARVWRGSVGLLRERWWDEIAGEARRRRALTGSTMLETSKTATFACGASGAWAAFSSATACRYATNSGKARNFPFLVFQPRDLAR